MFDSHHLDISTYSDIIDQPQATSSPKPTINVNKKKSSKEDMIIDGFVSRMNRRRDFS
jgi:hypothetical protein